MITLFYIVTVMLTDWYKLKLELLSYDYKMKHRQYETFKAVGAAFYFKRQAFSSVTDQVSTQYMGWSQLVRLSNPNTKKCQKWNLWCQQA